MLHLKESEDEFLERYRLEGIVRKYSDHITIPIEMSKEAIPPSSTVEGDEDGEDVVEDTGPEQINSATALWARNKNSIEEAEYGEFYKHVAHDFEAPLAHTHNRVEGKLEYTSLLFIPARAPFDLWDRNVRRGVKLYVRRVFVMDDAEHLMPTYLRFVKGVIDCADLPLNVSREILQQNRQIESIRSGTVKRVLDLLANLAKNEAEKYAKFWEHFGRVLKEGLIEDAKNLELIAKLLRFSSTHGEGEVQNVSLAQYVERMKAGQDTIYFITADNQTTARNSPHLEVFREKDIEVLLLTDEIDEWTVHHLTEFEGKSLQSVAKGELNLDAIGKSETNDEEAPAEDKPSDAPGIADLVSALKSSLEDRVKDVRTTSRLTSSPACLVAEDHEMGAHLERILRATGQQLPDSKPILEINPAHPIVLRLSGEQGADRREEWAALLFDQAVLSEGGRVGDPAAFVRRMNDMFLALAEGTPAA